MAGRFFLLIPHLSPADNGLVDAYDLICIGCGPAGEKAATQAGYFGCRKTLPW